MGRGRDQSSHKSGTENRKWKSGMSIGGNIVCLSYIAMGPTTNNRMMSVALGRFVVKVWG